MSRFASLQYCKTDLIATKGIVFVKYAKSSAACLAMETIQQTGTVRSRCKPVVVGKLLTHLHATMVLKGLLHILDSTAN